MDVLESMVDGVMILLFLFQGCLLQYFCGCFLESRLKNSFRNKFRSIQCHKVAVAVLYLLLRTVNWIWRPEEQTAGTVVHLVWMFIITTTLVLGLYRAAPGIASFLLQYIYG